MGKLNEFLICKECSKSSIEHFENGDLDTQVVGDTAAYKCPFCGTINILEDDE